MFDALNLMPFSAKFRGSFRKSLTVETPKMENKGNVSDIDLKDSKNEPFQYALDQNKAIGDVKRDAKNANIKATEKKMGSNEAGSIIIEFNSGAYRIISEYMEKLKEKDTLGDGIFV